VVLRPFSQTGHTPPASAVGSAQTLDLTTQGGEAHMHIYTLNVGQGQFVVVTGETQAIIIDTYVPLNPTNDIINVKGALATILQGKELVGLMVTGFDSDHFNEVGVKIVLNKYRPNWIMYPKYFKKTDTADACFAVIRAYETQTKFPRYSVSLEQNATRFYNKLSTNFQIEAFSPHADDMNSSNNCSLVCKIKELSSGRSYLVTGDTENDRWASIVKIFDNSIAADVLDAPHHGSKNGISAAALALIKPHTVLISAGVNNQYGHPSPEARQLFAAHAQKYYETCYGTGQSLKTVVDANGINTYKFTP
jgi:beta-lactamase superfamily II metal-dependent hydrolase